MTLLDHRDAVLGFLNTALPGQVFKSYTAAKKAAGVTAYAVVFIARSRREQARYTGGQTRDTYTVTVHNVGDSEDSCLWVQDLVDTLTDQTLTVTGHSLRPARYVTGQPPDLDDDGTTPLWFSISQFDIISDPA